MDNDLLHTPFKKLKKKTKTLFYYTPFHFSFKLNLIEAKEKRK